MSEQLQKEQWLCFQLGAETYAQQVRQVREILDYTSPVPVPGAESYVEGVLNIRGEIVTIVSGHQMLGQQESQASVHIIVLETGNGLIGMSVGEVNTIAQLKPEQIMPVDSRQTGSPVWATIEHDEQLLILTDFARSLTELDSYE
jgi:purine-binding chemotaxis protein CheW